MNDVFNRPPNPFPVTDTHAENTFALINAAVETWALMGIPVGGSDPAQLVVLSAVEWARRATSGGDEDRCHALVWELSVWIHRMSQQGIPFPPFDITTTCGDDECQRDHGAEVRTINTLFMSSLSGNYADAVKAYAARVWGDDRDPEDCLHERRIRVAAMFLVHACERVSEYRQGGTEETDKLADLFGEGDPT